MKKIVYAVIAIFSSVPLQGVSWWECLRDSVTSLFWYEGKKIDAKILEITSQTELIREQLKVMANNEDVKSGFEALTKSYAHLENQCKLLFMSVNKNDKRLGELGQIFSDFDAETKAYREKINKSMGVLQENQEHLKYGLGAIAIVAALGLGYSYYKDSAVPDTLKAKEQVLLELRNSQQAYIACKKANSGLNRVADDCEQQFADFFKADVRFKERYFEQA